ncbi:MAG: hypothetical protein ABTQ27_04975 [Amaricoccus sp.]|uniref:hypothetical protein n=1 Tax=Amaricoccus sp. TaxID=1872485 RepID=UPI003315A32C
MGLTKAAHDSDDLNVRARPETDVLRTTGPLTVFVRLAFKSGRRELHRDRVLTRGYFDWRRGRKISKTAAWSALGRRLDGLLVVHDRFCQLPSKAVNGSQEKALLESAVGLARAYLDLRASLAGSPDVSLPEFDETRLNSLAAGSLDDRSKSQRAANLAELVLRLSILRNDIDSVMFDGQEEIRSRAERAFRHLQWSIAADEAVRTAWISAFKNEPACEALGATHLLSHGIFAFKANSTSARTDLVFHEPIDTASAEAVADGLVLTEWKRLKDPNKLNDVVSGAEKQAGLYAAGVLGGRELRRVRYIVVVSCQQIAMPEDVRREDYVIRHVNIAVQPSSPSAAGPSLARASKQDRPV